MILFQQRIFLPPTKCLRIDDACLCRRCKWQTIVANTRRISATIPSRCEREFTCFVIIAFARSVAILIGGLVFPSLLAAADPSPLPAPSIIEPVLFATGFEFAEGPAFDRHGNLYVVNYRRRGTIGRITPDGAASILVDLAERSTGRWQTPAELQWVEDR